MPCTLIIWLASCHITRTVMFHPSLMWLHVSRVPFPTTFDDTEPTCFRDATRPVSYPDPVGNWISCYSAIAKRHSLCLRRASSKWRLNEANDSELLTPIILSYGIKSVLIKALHHSKCLLCRMLVPLDTFF